MGYPPDPSIHSEGDSTEHISPYHIHQARLSLCFHLQGREREGVDKPPSVCCEGGRWHKTSTLACSALYSTCLDDEHTGRCVLLKCSVW